MFSLPSAPLAGTKRAAEHVIDPQNTASGVAVEREHQVEHIDPRTLCCSTCCPDSPSQTLPDSRPAKRRASALKVGGYHGATAESSGSKTHTGHEFPDTCFETFCQDCDLDTTCTSPCALPCEDVECSKEDVCWDPHCDQGQECADQCVDPECTKAACPNDPCFCQQCDAQPCPLGDPNNGCHLAHTPPTATGTIFCFDNAPCHFQDTDHFSHPHLPTYDGKPCFSQDHGLLGQCDVTVQPSHTATPGLSPSNYTSLESTFSTQSSPTPGFASSSNCFLDIASDHCHIDNACCHGPTRACGDYLGVPQGNFDLWKLSLDQGQGIADDSLHGTQPGNSLSFDYPSNDLGNTFSSNLFNFDNSWMFPTSPFTPGFSTSDIASNAKFDMLASTMQEDSMDSSSVRNSKESTVFSSRPTTSASTPMPGQPLICKWQHAPGLPCLQTFDSAEALHRHIKSSHVDNCARCICQWEGCESCDRDFKQRSKLSRHLLGHAGHRPYACSFEGCNKTFATNQAKDNHERTHTGDRPYQCDMCDYTTTTHTQLQTHISALHLRKKEHKCRYCDFSCADSSNLSKHERTHQVSYTLESFRLHMPSLFFSLPMYPLVW
ncbi:hypothetical protein K491DRAFT_693922 [Lophiostoma macrostomum CBS 122681]|uniref:C2H2-type domain-containing protein n=1 Tax=Lophiostoma macrostomum CBS 122681 TaxID=1314788 RepID=A0A6A6T645_9PLEO|nr:hypothetical protein K491DRAFT_693922 [Lophiostoma macrostomum CBS 122681]